MSQRKKESVRRRLLDSREALLTVLHSLSDSQWDVLVFTEGETWRVSDLLRHLTAAERDMTRLMERIREGGGGVSPDFDLNRWNARSVRKALAKSPAALMTEMEQNRVVLLQFLDSLNSDDWDKRGRHGSLRVMTVEQILNQIAYHERHHTEDIRNALALNP